MVDLSVVRDYGGEGFVDGCWVGDVAVVGCDFWETGLWIFFAELFDEGLGG